LGELRVDVVKEALRNLMEVGKALKRARARLDDVKRRVRSPRAIEDLEVVLKDVDYALNVYMDNVGKLWKVLIEYETMGEGDVI